MEEFQKLETLTEQSPQNNLQEAKEYYGAGQCEIRAVSTDLRVAAALMRAQANFDRILKDTNNPFFKSKYATLDQVIAATRPHLRAEGLVVIQMNIQTDDRHGVFTRLLHTESGEELISELVAKPKEDTIQQIASILTYARRYEYQTILGLAPEDDDGAVASGTTDTRSQSEQRGQHQETPKRPTSSYPTQAAQNKPSNAPPVPPGVDLPRSTATTAVPSIPKTTESRPTPLESTELLGLGTFPTKDQYDAYIAKAIALTEQLEKAGLKSGRGLPAKTKLKRYIFHVCQVEKLEDLKIGQWDLLFTEFEKLLAADSKRAVELVENANAKEATA